ncbi:unnamed protein product [Trypanosoma congolense IL3000]|uniref:WGS project CAEQ00000000 data, annotated contig 244 n=1 Tax=Trypanosoma congolense (strain IL3000) TaxID=1068625 RepID=F9WHF2_TRYCI|nr:unnamed protein product [Trypanosoma congolense IL3000]CCD16745.1 unnamed protein product [Trypanosoma congolense IL3000]
MYKLPGNSHPMYSESEEASGSVVESGSELEDHHTLSPAQRRTVRGNGGARSDSFEESSGTPRELGARSPEEVYVMDTSFIVELETLSDLVRCAERCLVVVPLKVKDELYGLKEGVSNAGGMLRLLEKGSHPSTYSGIRLQKPREASKRIMSVQRNNDDHILACACYFKEKGYKIKLLTGDGVLKLKAHAEGLQAKDKVR